MELIAVVLVLFGLAWVFRKVLKDWADRAHEVSTVTSYEVKKSSIDRMSKVTITDETLKEALDNKTKLDAIDLI